MEKIRDIHKKESGCNLDYKLEGNLIIIGGAEDKKNNKNILHEVCNKIDKNKDELVIATVASTLPEELGTEYKYIFENLGVKNINILDVKTRQDANNINNVKIIKNASLVFFTGGDQLRITSILGGTKLYSVIHEKYKEGCIFVGTSAGASVMSDTMIVSGPSDESPRKCTLKMAPGLGLIKNVIIDQHFAQRGRIGRLLVGIAENPETLGIGIDEDTAIMVDEKAKLQVIGSGAVYVIDGMGITSTNVSEQYPDEVLSMYDIKLHVLKNKDKFDLNYRKPL
ncbi:cyanophycinase [Clostridium niameyense]|uniref:cyanophycinase n=1 Tax=Clostridium niameyense TaxID=1622073 RepID=UPI0009E4B2BD